MQFFRESMLELIIQTSTNLPPDLRQAMALGNHGDGLNCHCACPCASIMNGGPSRGVNRKSICA
jgi:hypothetical protein